MKKFCTFFILFFIVVLVIPAKAQIGHLDTSFDTDGIVTTPIALGNATAYSVAIQNDGKLVVAGYARDVFGSYMALTRYLPNGALDLSFDLDGIVTTDISPNDDVAYDVAIQIDGKIVVCGSSEQSVTDPQVTVVRYWPNGTLDSTFDGDGIAIAYENPLDQGVGSSLILQPDGKILVAGSMQGKFTVIRYLSTGQLDTTFNSNGILHTTFYNGFNDAQQINLQADGKIIVSGRAQDISGGQSGMVIVRYDTLGNLDTSFNHTGRLPVIGTSSILKLNSLLIQADQKIVLAGSFFSGNHNLVIVHRFLPDGSPDVSFGAGGSTYLQAGDDISSEFSAVLQPDGKIALCGIAHDGSNQIALVRFNPNGQADSSVDGDGLMLNSANMYASSQMAMQSDGKLVVVGTGTYTFGANIFYTARLNTSFPLGIQMALTSKEFVISPNPNYGDFTISLSSPSQHAQINLYDKNGKMVYQMKSQHESQIKVSLPFLPAGNYWMQVAEPNHNSNPQPITILNH